MPKTAYNLWLGAGNSETRKPRDIGPDSYRDLLGFPFGLSVTTHATAHTQHR